MDPVQIAWSSATVGPTPLSEVLPLDAQARAEIAYTIAERAHAIIAVKGFTSFGIGAVTALVCESIVFDQRQVYPLSHYVDEWQCCMSRPVAVGRRGIHATIPLQVNKAEQALLDKSARGLRDVLRKFGAAEGGLRELLDA